MTTYSLIILAMTILTFIFGVLVSPVTVQAMLVLGVGYGIGRAITWVVGG